MSHCKIYPLYREFLKELSKGQKFLERNYFYRYEDFLIKANPRLKELLGWKQRISLIKSEHYSSLFHFDRVVFPCIEDYIKRIQKVSPQNIFPDIYLYVGFFSPDGRVFMLENKWVIAIALERFQTFDDFSVILAHEWGHFLRRQWIPAHNSIKEKIFSEGLAMNFSHRVFKNLPLYRHLMMKRNEYFHLIDNLKLPVSLKRLKEKELNYIAFLWIKDLLKNFSFEELLKSPSSNFNVALQGYLCL